MTPSNQISVIVNKYIQDTNLSMRGFASELGISHAAISNWAAGKSEPNIIFLYGCLGQFNDWRHSFANEILCQMIPGYRPNGNGHTEQSPCGEAEK